MLPSLSPANYASVHENSDLLHQQRELLDKVRIWVANKERLFHSSSLNPLASSDQLEQTRQALDKIRYLFPFASEIFKVSTLLQKSNKKLKKAYEFYNHKYSDSKDKKNIIKKKILKLANDSLNLSQKKFQTTVECLSLKKSAFNTLKEFFQGYKDQNEYFFRYLSGAQSNCQYVVQLLLREFLSSIYECDYIYFENEPYQYPLFNIEELSTNYFTDEYEKLRYIESWKSSVQSFLEETVNLPEYEESRLEFSHILENANRILPLIYQIFYAANYIHEALNYTEVKSQPALDFSSDLLTQQKEITESSQSEDKWQQKVSSQNLAILSHFTKLVMKDIKQNQELTESLLDIHTFVQNALNLSLDLTANGTN